MPDPARRRRFANGDIVWPSAASSFRAATVPRPQQQSSAEEPQEVRLPPLAEACAVMALAIIFGWLADVALEEFCWFSTVFALACSSWLSNGGVNVVSCAYTPLMSALNEPVDYCCQHDRTTGHSQPELYRGVGRQINDGGFTVTQRALKMFRKTGMQHVW